MPKLKKIRWDISNGTSTQWQSSLQSRNGTLIQGQVDYDGTGTYTVSSSPAGASGTSTTLKGAKNLFRKYLFTK